ncbi:MAG: cupin domain-containing protein [Chitinophagales bacterium]|nr:cupin domain-containing protein [Chitinophagales bacterium]
MKFLPLTIIDINSESKDEVSDYLNLPLCLINDHVIRMSIMTEPFYWHLHPNSDEIFLAIEGSLYIDLETHTVELLPGQLFTVPVNVKHRTRPKGGRSVNLTFEHNEIKTVKLSSNEI